MNLTALFDQTVTLYLRNKGNASQRQIDRFLVTLMNVYWESGWEDADDSKYIRLLREAAVRYNLDKPDEV